MVVLRTLTVTLLGRFDHTTLNGAESNDVGIVLEWRAGTRIVIELWAIATGLEKPPLIDERLDADSGSFGTGLQS